MKDNEKFLEIHKKRRELEKEYEERLEEVQKDYQLPYGAADPTFYGAFGYEDLPPIDYNVERLAEEIRSLLKEEQKYITYIYPSDIAKESGKDSEKPWTSKDLTETIKKINEIADEGKPIEIMGHVSSLPQWVVTAILNELSQKNIPVIVDVERTSENITFHTYDVDLHEIKKEKEYSTNAVIKRAKGNQVLLTITDSKNIDNMILPDIDSEKDVFIEWDASVSRKTPTLQSLIAYAFRNNNSVSIGGDGKFTCAISNDENIQLGDITEDPTNKRKIAKTLEKKLKETQTVVTHYGDDLDNKSATYVLQKLLNRSVWNEEDKKELKIARVPAGQIKEGMLNVDTGGHKGSRIEEDGTIVIDGDPENGVKSAIEELSTLGYYYYIPEQIVELADTVPNKVSALDSRSGLALIRYLSGEQAFKLAEERLLDKTLTDEQLEEYGLTEAHEKQQGIIDNAVEKIEKYTKELPNGEKIVLAPEQIIAGSMIAYEKGIPYYASASNHLDKDKNIDGVTFAITSKPGTKLPEEILEYGKELEEEYRIDENTSGVFVNPNGQMIVAGGFKNPEFKIPNETIKGMLDKIEARFIGKDLEREEEQAEY